jgi:hypothetical protein
MSGVEAGVVMFLKRMSVFVVTVNESPSKLMMLLALVILLRSRALFRLSPNRVALDNRV